MPMLSNDLKDMRSTEEIRASMMQALKDNDSEAFYVAFEEMSARKAAEIYQQYEQKFNEMVQSADASVLSARGANQLTSDEKKYYQKLAEAMKSPNPKQALTDANLVMPKTIIDRVFDELQTDHPLLRKINFERSGGAIEMVMNTNGYQMAQWGKLCDPIVQELLSGFEVINAMLLKLSALLPVCKAMLRLGPEWLDRFVRQVLYEALANGLEYGIVAGTGKDEPIGMIRQVGAGVVVVDGVYPEKEQIALNSFDTQSFGNLLSMFAVDPNGKPRFVRDVILLVNPQDYFQRVFPATTVMAPDGTYRNDVLPYPTEVIQTLALDPGHAVLGIAYRYFATAGMDPDGEIDFSDHYHFGEDERVYIIKVYAFGRPMDNNAFAHLDISGLQPLGYKVEVMDPREPSDDATLVELKIGNKTLTPAFDPTVDTYEVATTDATNTIKATPADAGATVAISVNSELIANGTAATWAAGENTVLIVVTAEDGTTQESYTVTVTKS